MEKAEPTSYYGSLSAAETSDPQGGYQPPDGSYQSQSGYVPPPEQQSQSEYLPKIGVPSQSGYQPLPGYSSESGLPPHSGNPSVSGSPDAPQQPREYSWYQDIRRNRPQLTSLAAAVLIFASGGMSFSQSVGFGETGDRYPAAVQRHFQTCWFIAVIIGAIISAQLVEKLNKRTFYFLSSILVIVNGTLFVACSKSVEATITARYCDGIAFGLSLIPAIVAGSEQSVKRFRGLVLSVEHIGLTSGIVLEAVYTIYWESNWSLNTNQFQGVLALICGVLALVFTFIFTIESPIFYLRKDKEAEAIDSLHSLQISDTGNTETYALLYENKHLLDEDIARGRAENFSNGVVPMIKVCLFRALISMSFSVPLTVGIFMASFLNGSESSPYLYAVARMVGVVISIFTIDILGRRIFSALSLLLGGGMLIVVGALISSSFLLEHVNQIVILLLFYQLFAGIAAPASTCYLGEAFSVSVKPYFILVAVIIENIIQIIIVCCTVENNENDVVSEYSYALGILQVVFSIAFLAVMPDTMQTTLREALAKFKTLLHIGSAHR